MKKTKIIISYRVKILLIYLVITIIPILVFIGVVQTQYVDRMRSHTFEILERSAESLVDTLDGCMAQIESISDGLILMNEIAQNYLPDKPTEANAFRSKLGVYISGNTLFDEIAFYAADNDYLFSNKSSYTKERFLKQKHLDYLTIADIDLLVQESYGPVLLEAGGETAFCVLCPLHIRGQTKALIFSIPTTKLNAYMSEVLFGNEGYCRIQDGESNVLFSYSSNGDIPDEQVIEQCLAGQKSVRTGTSIWYCAESTSSVVDVAVSVLISNGSIHETINSIMRNCFAIVLVAMGLCFAASWLTSFINAKPIVKLSDKISSSIMKREEWSNEIEHIDASINHLRNLTITIQQQMAEVGDYLTFRLLCGTIESVDEANRLSKMLGTSIYANTYQVCIVDINEDHSTREVATSISSLLPPEVSCLTRTIDTGFVCVFFCSLDDQNTMDVFCEQFLQCYPKSKISFGNSYSQLAEIPLSFMEAFLAFESEESSVASFTYSDTLQKTIEGFKQAVESNDVQEILAFLQRIISDIETKRYSLSDGKCLFVQFLQMLSNSSLGSRLSNILPNAYVVISSDSSEMLLKAFEPVMKEIKQMHRSHSQIEEKPSLVDQMVKYIDANYRNPNFSVQQMAFDFRLTPSALSRYFRDHYGRNINDYMTYLKMERAKQLLQDTNLPIYEIGLELGYQGPNSFIRRFKATYGITPGEFRQDGYLADVTPEN